VHVKGAASEIYTLRLGWKSSSTHRYIPIYAVPAANVFMLRPERLHCQLSHLWHSSLHWGGASTRRNRPGVGGKWAQAERQAATRLSLMTTWNGGKP
jgi:hypothetical protein